ncbi:MAG TPA: hypothetical protein VM030_01600 [Acidimicrobiales bacterium]|nr:hypothetical protein [Acidimicrobiales bacterium]
MGPADDAHATVWFDDDDDLDPITAAAGWAGRPEPARIGVRLDLSRRPLAIVVKALTTLDVLTGGRLIVGVADEAEVGELAAAFGNGFRPAPVQVPHPPVVVRGTRSGPN